MKKNILLTVIGLLIFTFSISAKDLSPRRGPLLSYKIGNTQENRIQKIEDYLQLDKHYFDYLDSYAANCYFTLDILVWTATNRGWPYHVKPTDDVFHQRIAHVRWPDFDYEPGFRMGWGVKTPLDWDVYFYTGKIH